MKLETLGWNAFFEEHAAPFRAEGWAPARVVRDGRDLWHVVSEGGELIASVSGKLRHRVTVRSDLPTVGDWVMLQARPVAGRAIIQAVLPRRTAITRKVPGDATQTQVVASNIDTVFLVSALDGGRNYNLRRIERYLALTRESGAQPVLLLNKADLCEKPEDFVREVASVANDLPVYAVSAVTGLGLEAVSAHLQPGLTCALLGQSGVGKSALVNALMGDDAKETGEVRATDKRGRHTTSYRELIKLPGGALVVDNPGLRELQLWGDEESLGDVFPDVEALTGQCRFTDCRHEKEPGCAIQAALATGALEPRRFQNYLVLRAELDHLAQKKNHLSQLVEKRKWKAIHRAMRERQKFEDLGRG